MNRIYGRYGMGMIAWTLSMGLDAGATEYQTMDDRRTEKHLGGDIRFEWRRVLGPIDLNVGAMWRIISQSCFVRTRRLQPQLVILDKLSLQALDWVQLLDWVGDMRSPLIGRSVSAA